MNEQIKVLDWEAWVRESYVPDYAERVLNTSVLARDEAELKYEIYKLRQEVESLKEALRKKPEKPRSCKNCKTGSPIWQTGTLVAVLCDLYNNKPERPSNRCWSHEYRTEDPK